MDWLIFQISLAVFNIIGFGIASALMHKARARYNQEVREFNQLLGQVKELRENWERDVRTHFIPTPEWHRGWMWN